MRRRRREQKEEGVRRVRREEVDRSPTQEIGRVLVAGGAGLLARRGSAVEAPERRRLPGFPLQQRVLLVRGRTARVPHRVPRVPSRRNVPGGGHRVAVAVQVFPDQPRPVPGGIEPGRNRFTIVEEPPSAVVDDSSVPRVLSGQQARAGGATEGRRDVPAQERRPLRDEMLLDEGHAGSGARRQVIAVEAALTPSDGVPALIVREDDDEVRPGRYGGGGRCDRGDRPPGAWRPQVPGRRRTLTPRSRPPPTPRACGNACARPFGVAPQSDGPPLLATLCLTLLVDRLHLRGQRDPMPQQPRAAPPPVAARRTRRAH